MRAFHDSREADFRSPYGAVAQNTPVTLRIDVWEAPGANVVLRTWFDGVGERLYEMKHVKGGADGSSRFETTIAPAEAGIVWYQFVIQEQSGHQVRYGAQDGRFGGEGRLAEWEPPSFQLTVFDPNSALGDEHPAYLAEAAEPDDTADQAIARAFTRALCGLLRGELSAPSFVEALETIREGYPARLYGAAFDVLGRADKEDLLATLADADSFENLQPSQLGLAKGRLWCASLIQTLLPYAPDKTSDPYSPIAKEWGTLDGDCETIVQNAADLRRALPLFETGSLALGAANDDVFFLRRTAEDGTSAYLLVNSSRANAYDVAVPLDSEAVSEIMGGYAARIVNDDEARNLPRTSCGAERYACAHLYQLGTAVLYLHPETRLQLPMQPGLGVLAHITSLPLDEASGAQHNVGPQNDTTEEASQESNEPTGPDTADETADPAAIADLTTTVDPTAADATDMAPQAQPQIVREQAAPECMGTLGAPARAFVDWLADAGVRYWQVLPVNPTDDHGSPYAGISAFAGNARLLEKGTSGLEALFERKGVPRPEIDTAHLSDYRAFCEREADWLEPYACFMAIRLKQGAGKVWQDWPKRWRSYDPKLVAANAQLAEYAESWRRLQFLFDRQWKDLRSYANERGIQLIGDMPIYVSADSADVWANPAIFELGKDGKPSTVAGCPPDPFAEEGQVWGNPVYDWDALRSSGYDWWLRRLKRSFELYDYVRLDHFIGFARYFCIPAGEKAFAGTYRPGPGLDFFAAAHERFGALPLIAEDLGMITPAVRALGAACGFPGMDIVQFVDGNDPLSGYQPRPEKIAFTGTHDNQTLAGYAAKRYPHLDAADAADELARKVVTCSAPVAIMPLQDVLLLGDEARMNIPGTTEGNWAWQARQSDIDNATKYLHELVELHERKD